MLGAEHLLADRQRALEERPRPGIVPLGPQQAGEVVEAGRRVEMLGAEHLLVDRQRALVVAAAPRQGRPWACSKEARLLRLVAVSRCSGPSTFSRIASARS